MSLSMKFTLPNEALPTLPTNEYAADALVEVTAEPPVGEVEAPVDVAQATATVVSVVEASTA